MISKKPGEAKTKPPKTNTKSHDNLIRSFGRIKTRKLSKAKKDKIQNLLPKISIRIPDFKLEKVVKIDPKKFFDFQPKEIWLEIGFGFGEHIFERARKNKNIGIIGCEPHVNGVASLLNKISDYNEKVEEKIQNIRILNGDARILLNKLKANSLSKIFILFPDPWPKKRHHKRRIIQLEFLDLLSSKLKKGGTLFFASDIEGYIGWTLEKVVRNSKFKWTAKSEKDWKQEPKWWVRTRYQDKAIREGRTSAFLEFKNIN
ncbi:tRNA (guanosine(46)-N7)-methyltransferase TrmB [Pseudomonadota bacterium]